MAQVAPDPYTSSGPAVYNPSFPAPASATVVEVPKAGIVGATHGEMVVYRTTPVLMTCQFCGATITTSLHYAVGMYTWTFVLVLIVVGLWMGCCLIPFFINSCKDVVHSCPNCQKEVGRYYNHM